MKTKLSVNCSHMYIIIITIAGFYSTNINCI